MITDLPLINQYELPEIEIRKEFTFNNMHIVRNCSSERCKYSAHGHTYHVEVFLTSDKLDNGGMAVDFGLLKGTMKSLIKIFDGAYTLWNAEQSLYRNFVYKNFKRVVEVPFTPSAERYSIFFFQVLNYLIKNTSFNNGEGNIEVSKVIVHETKSGYAIADKTSAALVPVRFPNILTELKFNFDCPGKEVLNKLVNINNKPFINSAPEQQIDLSFTLFH